MRISYFAVFDKKAKLFGQAFPSVTRGTAERSFTESLKNPESQHGKYPDDFALYRLFDLDDQTGVVLNDIDDINETSSPPVPILIVEASTLVNLA